MYSAGRSRSKRGNVMSLNINTRIMQIQPTCTSNHADTAVYAAVDLVRYDTGTRYSCSSTWITFCGSGSTSLKIILYQGCIEGPNYIEVLRGDAWYQGIVFLSVSTFNSITNRSSTCEVPDRILQIRIRLIKFTHTSFYNLSFIS